MHRPKCTVPRAQPTTASSFSPVLCSSDRGAPAVAAEPTSPTTPLQAVGVDKISTVASPLVIFIHSPPRASPSLVPHLTRNARRRRRSILWPPCLPRLVLELTVFLIIIYVAYAIGTEPSASTPTGTSSSSTFGSPAFVADSGYLAPSPSSLPLPTAPL